MRFAPPEEPVVLYETGFDSDILDRARFGASLSQIIERIEDPLVIAVDGKWGTGKSFFLKRWVGSHRNQFGGIALTVYFDAFEHDYLSDPITALVAALDNRLPPESKSKLDSAKRIAMKFAKPAVRLALAAASSGATVILSDFWDGVAEGAKGEADKALADYWEREAGRHAAMEQFRTSISSLTEGPDGAKKPLVIVIDELDRCRPDFALDLLEVVKHFFAVPYVHFIFGVNLEALENSVKSRYGSEIDASTYLQKFVSFTLSLPDEVGENPRVLSSFKYAQFLGEKMGTPKKLLEEILDQVRCLSEVNHVSMRDISRIMSTAALLPEEIASDNVLGGWRTACVTLLITRIIKPPIFRSLVRSSITEEQLFSLLGATPARISNTLPNGDRNPEYNHRLMYITYCWKYIIRDGQSDGSEVWKHLPRAFDGYGDPHGIKEIPRRIFERYLGYISLGDRRLGAVKVKE
jgi:hypothetical protein